jgi:hypothetical protein
MARTGKTCLLCLIAALAACESPRPPAEPARSASAAPATPQPTATPRASASDAPRAAGPFAHVYVYDIDWRSGGRALFLRGDGSGILRVAGKLENNVQNEKRYELSPDPERAKKLHAILESHGAAKMNVDPMQAPGDVTAIVRLLPNAGSEIGLEGPAGRNEPFRKLLLELAKALESISTDGIHPTHDGNLDPYWTPPFASPSALVSRHTLGRMKEGKLQPVATLVFDRRFSATLTIDVPGDEADAVKRAWAEVSSEPVLSVKSEEEDGTEHRLVGKKVRRGEKDYPAGALDALSTRFGVFAVEQKR